jgi:hypothetical protein
MSKGVRNIQLYEVLEIAVKKSERGLSYQDIIHD